MVSDRSRSICKRLLGRVTSRVSMRAHGVVGRRRRQRARGDGASGPAVTAPAGWRGRHHRALKVGQYGRSEWRAPAGLAGHAAAGAKVTGSAAGLASADIVFVTVGTSQDLIDALTGPAGLTSGGQAPSVVVDCSTVSAGASEQVRAALAADGCRLLAAPVMGNPKVAAVGRLTFAVSGSRAAFGEVHPYLDLLGAGATYVGEGELARTVKLCHNLFLGVVTQSLAEVTVLAEKSGISRQALLACLNNS